MLRSVSNLSSLIQNFDRLCLKWHDSVYNQFETMEKIKGPKEFCLLCYF